MQNYKVQWLTSDSTLFELDWLTHLTGGVDINIANNVKQLEVCKKSVLITNRHLPFRSYLDKLRENQANYGLILLSDENLTESMEFVHDPACKFVFRNYINPFYFNNPKVYTFGLGYKRGFKDAVTNIKSAQDRKYTWSFLGTPHTDRKDALQIFKDLTPNKIHETSGFSATDQVTVQEYADILSDSIFALCPLGQSSADSFRIYEALEAGCIPITLNNSSQIQVVPNYWSGIFKLIELPFVHADSWATAKKIVEEIIDEKKLDQTQSDCQNLWNKWKYVWREELAECIKQL